jgi:hypothetical protein
MSGNSKQPPERTSTENESVSDVLIRGADLLDRAHEVCEGIERRAQAAIGQFASTREGEPQNHDRPKCG